MKIYIISSTGSGTTELSAFDKTLLNVGIANTNLIPLSSVIPPNPKIVFQSPDIEETKFGNRLYLVISRNSTSINGKTVSAGIGWVIEKENKFGLFVEHEAETKEEVRKLIERSLQNMMGNRSEYAFSDIETEITEVKCIKEPVCAISCAVYSLENWG